MGGGYARKVLSRCLADIIHHLGVKEPGLADDVKRAKFTQHVQNDMANYLYIIGTGEYWCLFDVLFTNYIAELLGHLSDRRGFTPRLAERCRA